MKFKAMLLLCSFSWASLSAQHAAFFSYSPSAISNGSTPVIFTFISNTAGAVTLTNIIWSYGDGKVQSGPPGFTSATNIYDMTNTYIATLTMLFDNGTAAIGQQVVNVNFYQPGSIWLKIAEPANLLVRSKGAFWVTPFGVVGATGTYGLTTPVTSTFGSDNGNAWSLLLANPPFQPRAGAGYFMGGGQGWLLGGLFTNAVRSNDVWVCADGNTWQRVTAAAAWGGRDLFGAAYYHGRLWVIGGHVMGGLTNDTWSSADGVNWVLHSGAGPWGARERHAVAVHNDRIWLIGGYSNAAANDVWSTQDGTNWVLENANAPFGPRYDHRVAVAEGRIWLTGGFDGSLLKRDVWFSHDGAIWKRATGNPPWSPRKNHGFVYYNGNLAMIGGETNGGDTPEIWVSQLAPRPIVPNQTNIEMNAGRWRLIGLPISNAVLNVTSVFSNLGASELWTWDAFAPTNGPFLKYVRPMALFPTKGYWLLSEFPVNLKATGTPPSEPAFAMLIGGNWNLAANPFPYPIDVSSLKITGSPSNYLNGVSLSTRPDIVDPNSLFAYSAQGAAGYVKLGSNQAIPPGAGYWIWAHSNVFVAMPPTPGTNLVPPAFFGAAPPGPAAPAPAGAVSIRLGYATGDQIDRESSLTLAPGGQFSSAPKPPAPRDHASLQLWSGSAAVSAMTRPLARGVQRYPFTLSGGRPGAPSTLTWDLSAGPGWTVFLREPASALVVDASSSKSLPLAVSAMGNARTFELVVAPEGTPASSLLSFTLGQVAVFPNPVPLGGAISLRVGLDREATLTLELRDMAGRLRLRRETQAPADPWSPTVWNVSPTRDDGRPLDAGIYGWRLVARSATGENTQVTGKLQITGK